MRALLWILAIFAVTVAITLAAKYDPGFVLLTYPPYRIELSLSLLLTLIILLFVAMYGALRLAVHTLRLPAYVRAFRLKRRRETARKSMAEGLTAYFEGRYNKAEKFAATALELHESPVISAVMAARSAHALNAYQRRDDYLAKAESIAPDYPVARLLTKAELFIDQRHYQEALTVIHQLYEFAPKHITAMKMELKAQRQLKNWDQTLVLINQLEKRDAIEPVKAEQLKINAYLENLKRKGSDNQSLRDYWLKIPTTDKLNNKIALTAARYFIALGNITMAANIVEQSLEKYWDSDLVKVYASCAHMDAVKQIERAEKWLLAHPRDAALLLTLGRLCTRRELWGKAQSYLEASVSIEPSVAAHLALAQLHEKMQRLDDACTHYRYSLEMAIPRD